MTDLDEGPAGGALTVSPHGGPCDHGACREADFLAVARVDDPRCCAGHHPEARKLADGPPGEFLPPPQPPGRHGARPALWEPHGAVRYAW
ncbi:hypothetical protein [Streptomyces sp. NPDC008125]|uniref:hypothetical protein n=1 Tax=Streptomyces sp. NPDC008125 TaxID=3364811 RepID=UPI0036E90BBA